MKKNLLLVAAIFAGIASYAQCEAVSILNEDFSDFTIATSNAFPQQCWNALGSTQTGPWLYTDQKGTPLNQYAVYYTHFSGANVPGYFITPELSTIDGSHQLSFTTNKLGGGPNNEIPAGNITLQIGLISDPASTTDFEAIGTVITVTNESTAHTVTVPASTKKYIAFKFVADAATNAAALDNVVWDVTPTPPCAAVADLNEDFNSFAQGLSNITENCWSASGNGPLLYVDGNDEATENVVNFYANGSADTAAYLISPELIAIDGTRKLSFDAKYVGGPGNVTTVQAGTITTAGDFANFHPVGEVITLTTAGTSITELEVPATADKFIAFKFVTSFAHGAASIDNIVFEEVETPVTPCEAVAGLDENFNTFAQGLSNITENCWSASDNGPLLYVDGNDEATENVVNFYANGSADTAAYLISPELIAIDGTRKLSFDAKYVGGPGNVTTVQAGTITTAGDFANFHPVGEVIILTTAGTSITELEVPATADKFIAFKFVTSFAHGAASIDNIKYDTTAGLGDLNKASFSIYPNPTADRNITINHNLDTKGSVNVYTLTGAKVYTGELDTTGTQSLNLSSLSAGMYIVKIESGNYSESKKLIVQ